MACLSGGRTDGWDYLFITGWSGCWTEGCVVGAGPLVSALGAGQTGGNHLRGGLLEGARRLGGATNSSLSVAGVGPMGGVVDDERR